MFLFIITNLVMAVLVQYQPLAVDWLTLESVNLGVMSLGVLSMLAGYFGYLKTVQWHDALATLVMLAWYGGWWPEFEPTTLMFWVYPLYFALVTGIVNLSLIQRAPNFDAESVSNLRHLEGMTRFSFRFVVALLLFSLFLPQHYTFFPVVMTFFIIRHTMLVCIEVVDS